MTAAQFLAVFFGRAADVVRERYGADAYIAHDGQQIAIRGRRGRLLGAGLTLREAMAQAAVAATASDLACAECDRTDRELNDDNLCRSCRGYVRN